MKVLRKKTRQRRFIKRLKENVLNYIQTIPEIRLFLCILIMISFILIMIDALPWDKDSFLGRIIIEAHGLIPELLIFGILITVYNKIVVERIIEIRRIQEEINDYKERNDNEAKIVIKNRIKKLNKLGFTKIDLSRCHLENTKLFNVRLNNANLYFTNLEGANLESAILDNAILTSSVLRGAYLEGARFKSAKLDHADLERAYNRGEKAVWFNLADLSFANLQNARFREGYFDKANFFNANLSGISLRFCSLKEADLRHANLEGAELIGINLTMANLFQAKLKYAVIKTYYEELSHGGPIHYIATFNKANLEGADLEGAELENVDFTDANLTGANLVNIKGVTIGQISKAKTLYQAKLDHNLEKLIRERFPHLLDKPKLKETIG